MGVIGKDLGIECVLSASESMHGGIVAKVGGLDQTLLVGIVARRAFRASSTARAL